MQFATGQWLMDDREFDLRFAVGLAKEGYAEDFDGTNENEALHAFIEYMNQFFCHIVTKKIIVMKTKYPQWHFSKLTEISYHTFPRQWGRIQCQHPITRKYINLALKWSDSLDSASVSSIGLWPFRYPNPPPPAAIGNLNMWAQYRYSETKVTQWNNDIWHLPPHPSVVYLPNHPMMEMIEDPEEVKPGTKWKVPKWLWVYREHHRPLYILLRHCYHLYFHDRMGHYMHFMRWFSRLLQYPGEKLRTAILLKSIQEQAGKGVLFNAIGMQVIGRPYFVFSDNNNDIFAEFNATFQYCMFLLADEFQQLRQQLIARLKNTITEPTSRCHAKFENIELTVENYINIVGLTNAGQMLLAERRAEGRIFCLRISY